MFFTVDELITETNSIIKSLASFTYDKTTSILHSFKSFLGIREKSYLEKFQIWVKKLYKKSLKGDLTSIFTLLGVGLVGLGLPIIMWINREKLKMWYGAFSFQIIKIVYKINKNTNLHVHVEKVKEVLGMILPLLFTFNMSASNQRKLIIGELAMEVYTNISYAGIEISQQYPQAFAETEQMILETSAGFGLISLIKKIFSFVSKTIQKSMKLITWEYKKDYSEALENV